MSREPKNEAYVDLAAGLNGFVFDGSILAHRNFCYFIQADISTIRPAIQKLIN